MATNRNVTMEAHNEAFRPEDDYEEIDSPGHKDVAMEIDSDNMTDLCLNSPGESQRMMMSSLYDELQDAVNVEGNGNDFLDDVPIASGGQLSDLVTVSDDEEVDTALLSKVGAAGYKSLHSYPYSQACYTNSVVTVPNAQVPGGLSLEEEMRASLLSVGANGLEENKNCANNNNCSGTVNLPDTPDSEDMLKKLVKTPVYLKKNIALGGANNIYQPCTVENSSANQGRGWRSRDRPNSLDGSEDSYGGSVSNSSSMLSLLKRIGRHHGLVSGRNNRYSGEQNQLLSPTGKSGQALLTRTLEQVKRSLEDLSPTISRPTDSSEEKKLNQLKNTYLKNLIVLSIGFMLIYAPFFALRNLQSSINPDGGLGLLSMSCLYAAFLIGCVISAALVQNIRPKMAILMSLVGYLLYTISNFYPGYYTLVPASAILGFTMALLWTAQGTYITSIAVAYAAVAGKNHNSILGLFNGFFLFLIQVAQILGNLISSTVFNIEMAREDNIYMNNTATSSLQPVSQRTLYAESPPNFCGSKYCHIFQIDHARISVHKHMLMSLIGVFTVFTLIGVLVLGVFLNKLDVIFRRSKGSACKQALSIFGFHRDPKVALLVPLMVYMGMEQAFMYGEITKVSQFSIDLLTADVTLVAAVLYC